jgi:predicted phosphodiesterase
MSVLGAPHARRVLIDELENADQVVLLGDLLALRQAPLPEVLERARPFLEELGEALAGRRVVIVPGNHDHQLAGPLLEHQLDGVRGSLQLERPLEPGEPGPAGAVAEYLHRAEAVVAYPGLWLRPDVYATHGHYLDCHMTVPRPECLLAALMQAGIGRLPEQRAAPGDYEAVLAPLYAFAYSHAQAGSPSGGGRSAAARRRLTRGTWRWLKDRRDAPQWAAAGAIAYGALATANRVGLRRFRADLSIAELERAGVRAMAEVVRRLGAEADYVIFGHTHRAGPRGEEPGWTFADGKRLVNTGSWVYSSGLIGDAADASPYWPGGCALVGAVGPPELRGLLDELRPSPARA